MTPISRRTIVPHQRALLGPGQRLHVGPAPEAALGEHGVGRREPQLLGQERDAERHEAVDEVQLRQLSPSTTSSAPSTA